MYLGTVLTLCMLAGFSNGQYIGTGQTCGLSYDKVVPQSNWICNDNAHVTPYSTVEGAVNSLLLMDAYWNASEYLSITRNCQSYVDQTQNTGANEYYKYQSVCQTNRRPVQMIWATVPGYTPTPEQAGWQNGLLPVHVLEGQNLYDVECVHPWSDGMPQRRRGSRGRGKRNANKYASGIYRHHCLIGYGYNPNLICKRSGFISREVLVYSQHANIIFSVVVPDVPTSCACSYCACGHNGIPGIKSGK